MKKNYRIEIPVDKEEKEIIERKAGALGLSIAEFARLFLLKGQIKSMSIDIPNNERRQD